MTNEGGSERVGQENGYGTLAAGPSTAIKISSWPHCGLELRVRDLGLILAGGGEVLEAPVSTPKARRGINCHVASNSAIPYVSAANRASARASAPRRVRLASATREAEARDLVVAPRGRATGCAPRARTRSEVGGSCAAAARGGGAAAAPPPRRRRSAVAPALAAACCSAAQPPSGAPGGWARRAFGSAQPRRPAGRRPPCAAGELELLEPQVRCAAGCRAPRTPAAVRRRLVRSLTARCVAP